MAMLASNAIRHVRAAARAAICFASHAPLTAVLGLAVALWSATTLSGQASAHAPSTSTAVSAAPARVSGVGLTSVAYLSAIGVGGGCSDAGCGGQVGGGSFGFRPTDQGLSSSSTDRISTSGVPTSAPDHGGGFLSKLGNLFGDGGSGGPAAREPAKAERPTPQLTAPPTVRQTNNITTNNITNNTVNGVRRDLPGHDPLDAGRALRDHSAKPDRAAGGFARKIDGFLKGLVGGGDSSRSDGGPDNSRDKNPLHHQAGSGGSGSGSSGSGSSSASSSSASGGSGLMAILSQVEQLLQQVLTVLGGGSPSSGGSSGSVGGTGSTTSGTSSAGNVGQPPSTNASIGGTGASAS